MKTIAQQLNVKEFPFEIHDKNGNKIYYEESDGYWYKNQFDVNGNEIYFENSDVDWIKRELDSNGKEIYYEDSTGYWCKNEGYSENSKGTIKDNRPKPSESKIIEQLKEQRVKAEQTFIKNSFAKRNSKIDAPCPDTDADLDAIGELNLAISILENYGAVKEPDE